MRHLDDADFVDWLDGTLEPARRCGVIAREGRELLTAGGQFCDRPNRDRIGVLLPVRAGRINGYRLRGRRSKQVARLHDGMVGEGRDRRTT